MRVRWLGEDESETVPGPSFTIWHGLKFRVEQWVEVTDEGMIQSARGNRFFEVEEIPDAQEAQEAIEAPKEEGNGTAPDSGYSPIKKKEHRRKAKIAARDDAAKLE